MTPQMEEIIAAARLVAAGYVANRIGGIDDCEDAPEGGNALCRLFEAVWITSGNQISISVDRFQNEWNKHAIPPKVETAKTVTRPPHDRPHSHVEPPEEEKQRHDTAREFLRAELHKTGVHNLTPKFTLEEMATWRMRPDVEPSAAENEPETWVSRDGMGHYIKIDGRWQVDLKHPANYMHSDTLARMLELARKCVRYASPGITAHKLAALVIKTFGEKK